jgi:hypothetical protein
MHQQNSACNKACGAPTRQVHLHCGQRVAFESGLHYRAFIHKVGDYDQVNKYIYK